MHTVPGPLFTKQTDVLPPNFVMYQSREIGCYNDRIALKYDRHLGSAAAGMPAKFQNDRKSLNLNLVVTRLHEILRYDVRQLREASSCLFVVWYRDM